MAATGRDDEVVGLTTGPTIVATPGSILTGPAIAEERIGVAVPIEVDDQLAWAWVNDTGAHSTLSTLSSLLLYPVRR